MLTEFIPPALLIVHVNNNMYLTLQLYYMHRYSLQLFHTLNYSVYIYIYIGLTGPMCTMMACAMVFSCMQICPEAHVLQHIFCQFVSTQ